MTLAGWEGVCSFHQTTRATEGEDTRPRACAGVRAWWLQPSDASCLVCLSPSPLPAPGALPILLPPAEQACESLPILVTVEPAPLTNTCGWACPSRGSLLSDPTQITLGTRRPSPPTLL